VIVYVYSKTPAVANYSGMVKLHNPAARRLCGNILVSVPDLPGLHTFGGTVAETIYMAQDAARMWLWDAENKGESIPSASNLSDASRYENSGQFVSLIMADTDEYGRQTETKAVKKTLSMAQ
jgi:predicted RNase H-like HicB family nuclease